MVPKEAEVVMEEEAAVAAEVMVERVEKEVAAATITNHLLKNMMTEFLVLIVVENLQKSQLKDIFLIVKIKPKKQQ